MGAGPAVFARRSFARIHILVTGGASGLRFVACADVTVAVIAACATVQARVGLACILCIWSLAGVAVETCEATAGILARFNGSTGSLRPRLFTSAAVRTRVGRAFVHVCSGRKSPVWAVKRPARPCKSTTPNRFAMETLRALNRPRWARTVVAQIVLISSVSTVAGKRARGVH